MEPCNNTRGVKRAASTLAPVEDQAKKPGQLSQPDSGTFPIPDGTSGCSEIAVGCERAQACSSSAVIPPISSALCENCSRFDLLGALNGQRTDHTQPAFAVNAIEKNGKPHLGSCALCHFLETIVDPSHDGQTISLQLIPIAEALGVHTIPFELVSVAKALDVDAYFNQTKRQSVLKEILVYKISYVLGSQFYSQYFGIAAVQPNDHTYLRILEPGSFDVNLVRQWMKYCDHHPSTCKSHRKGLVRSFRVIDCRQKTLIAADAECIYAALSYVWGVSLTLTDNERRAIKRGDLKLINLPDTIESAINVCLQLDIRYLWVDRYCLDESDEAIKTHQLRCMDLIYSRSYLTIIAAYGDAFSGLPGVRNRLRLPQSTVTIRGQVIAAWLPVVSNEVRNSKWASRAWTYQELLLSRRRLIFTRSQVAFECNSMHMCESVNMPLADVHTAKKRLQASLSRSAIISNTSSRFTDPGNILLYIQEYNQRDLTKSEDALNAFQGIFRVFKEQEKKPVCHLGGIPVFRDGRFPPTALGCFLCLLAWRLEYPGSRRPEFPTWSWTGTQGFLKWFPEKLGRQHMMEWDQIYDPKDTVMRLLLPPPAREPLDFPNFETLPIISEQYGDEINGLEIKCCAVRCSLFFKDQLGNYLPISSLHSERGSYEYFAACRMDGIANCYYPIWLDRYPTIECGKGTCLLLFLFSNKNIEAPILVEEGPHCTHRIGSSRDADRNCALQGHITLDPPLLAQMEKSRRTNRVLDQVDASLSKLLWMVYRQFHADRSNLMIPQGPDYIEKMEVWTELLKLMMEKVEIVIN